MDMLCASIALLSVVERARGFGAHDIQALKSTVNTHVQRRTLIVGTRSVTRINSVPPK